MKNKFYKNFLAPKEIVLEKIPTAIPTAISPEKAKDALKKIRKRLSKLQEVMYAHNRYSVLICLQGMDTSGKDSLIREVFQEFNVRGIEVRSFKTPTEAELQHDYLWRHIIALPERGKFGVFNRTHYENVLVTRVHPEYILNEHLPGITAVKDISNNFWNTRFEQIIQFEKQLVENGTILFKFYLHISKEEQKKRLLRRLEEAKHQWAFSPGDLAERALWKKYMSCYEAAIEKTNKKQTPWHVVPADDKDICRYIVAKIILEQLQTYKDMQYPTPDKKISENITAYKNELNNE